MKETFGSDSFEVYLKSPLSILTRKVSVNLHHKSSYLVFEDARAVSRTKIAVVGINHDSINVARNYYFSKTSAEVRMLDSPSRYQDKAEMQDLLAASFCVPVTDSISPNTYAIVMDTHWFDPDINHGGIDSVLRVSQITAYIIGERELVKSIKRSCTKCRILHKKGVCVAMGQIGEDHI